MRKRTLILRDPATKLRFHESYLEIISVTGSYTVAFVHIARIYLNKSIAVDIGTCYAISQKAALFLIDKDGYILARLAKADDAAV